MKYVLQYTACKNLYHDGGKILINLNTKGYLPGFCKIENAKRYARKVYAGKKIALLKEKGFDFNHNKKKKYFPFNLEGFKQIQLYVEKHNLENVEIYTEETENA